MKLIALTYVQNTTFILAELPCNFPKIIPLKLLSESAVGLFLEPLLLAEGH